VAVAEAAFQRALAYANERRQGKAPGWTGEGMAPIVHHPDVQRDLLTMKALTHIARSICYATAHATDMARANEGDDARHWQERANLLTPVAKAFSTDIGVEVASLGVQVHGGMGYVEETGAASLYRDARIAPIYEGTNGIQAIDLVTRKLPQSGGDHVKGYIAELRADIEAVRSSNRDGFGATADRCTAALDALEEATDHLQKALAEGRMEQALAGATPYLRLFALAAGGAYLARAALAGGRGARGALPLPCRKPDRRDGGAEAPGDRRRRQPACRRRGAGHRLRSATMSEHIEITRKGAVQIIRMNRPDKKNAITRAMYAVMAKALTEGDAMARSAATSSSACRARFRRATTSPISWWWPPAARAAWRSMIS
jgi:hypothetical protein